MAIARSGIIGGPAKCVFDSATFWSEGDITLTPEVTYSENACSMFGKVDESVVDAIVRVGFTPYGEWSNLSKLFPSAILTPTIGGRLFGDTDQPLQIWSSNGDLYTVTAAALTKPPPIILGVDKPLFGPLEFTGVVGTNKDLSDENALYQIQTSQTDPGGQFATTNYKKQRYTASWGAVSGFTSFQAEEAWTIEINVKLEPVKVQGLTVDYKVLGVEIMAKCKPVGPTASQIEAAMKLQGTGNEQGRRLSGAAYDLVITGTGVSVTLNQAALKTAGYVFGAKALRNGEIGFVTTTEFSTGTAQALMVLS